MPNNRSSKTEKRLTVVGLFLFVPFFLISCFTLDQDKTRFLNPAKLKLSSFDFKLNEEQVAPGNSYRILVDLYNEKRKKINGNLKYEDLVVTSENNSFHIGKNGIMASEEILDSVDFEYRLTVSLKGNTIPEVTKSFSYQINSANPIAVDDKSVYLELSYYNAGPEPKPDGVSDSVLVFDRGKGKYYLRSDKIINIIAGIGTDTIYILYPYSSKLASRVQIYTDSSLSVIWDGQVIGSPLKDSILLFTDLDAPGFDRTRLAR